MVTFSEYRVAPAQPGPGSFSGLPAFLEDVSVAPDLPRLCAAALRVREVIPGDVAHFNQVDVARGVMLTSSDPVMASSPEATALYRALRHQHPVIRHLERSGDTSWPLAISDLVSEVAFRASDLYVELYRELGMADQLIIPVPHPVATVTLCVGRKGWGFSRDEHRVARAVQRSLTAALCTLWRRESAGIAAGIAGGLLGASGLAIYVLDRFGWILGLDGDEAHVSAELGRAITHLGATTDAGVPGAHRPGPAGLPRSSVLAECIVNDPLGRATTVQLLDGGGTGLRPVLITCRSDGVGDRDLRSFGFTGRQAEVMAMLLCGRSTAEAACDLGISPRTVEKHVEAVCRKLGVRTRTEALLTLATQRSTVRAAPYT